MRNSFNGIIEQRDKATEKYNRFKQAAYNQINFYREVFGTAYKTIMLTKDIFDGGNE